VLRVPREPTLNNASGSSSPGLEATTSRPPATTAGDDLHLLDAAWRRGASATRGGAAAAPEGRDALLRYHERLAGERRRRHARCSSELQLQRRRTRFWRVDRIDELLPAASS